MKIKDIIFLAGTYLNREDVLSYLNGDTSNADENLMIQLDTFTRCANIVISELASTYLPLIKSEEFISKNGKVYYKDLTERVLTIKGVYDLSMKERDCSISTEYLKTDLEKGIVRYQYMPSNYGIDDEIGYTEKDVTPRVLCFGVLGEFCLTERRFEESVMWRNRYVEEIANIVVPKNKSIKQRRFE